MAFSFSGENEIAGAASFILDPLSPAGVPARELGVYSESISPIDAASAVSRSIFIAPYAMRLIGVQAVFGTAGGAAAAVTVEKLTGTTAPAGGTALLTATLSLTGAANTVASGTLVSTAASLTLAAGDRLGLVFSGTQTGLVGLVVSLQVQKN